MTALQALIAAAVAGALVVAGVAYLAGPGWALIAAGGWVTAVTVLLYDPASGRPRSGVRRGGFRVDGP
ncbi:hypothetical protein [Mycobacterium malmoense]|uniref:hypothetical protein n=1 Tax=Mycobacterium malmoense TaxID=1780 RepID=UPI0008F85615|nr:hypothetical protein [Mycobacterium malmoense]OIN79865.1 hypothetical protein BMG05_15770 [Mycobacterium malmoense]